MLVYILIIFKISYRNYIYNEKSNEFTSVKTINKYELYKLFTNNTSHITTIHSDYIKTTLDKQ